MTRRQRRTHRSAIRQTRKQLRRGFPRVVATVAQKHTARLFIFRLEHSFSRLRTFRHKVNGTANPATAKFRRHTVFVNFNFFNLIQVNRSKINRTARRIVQRDSVHANDNVLCRDSTDAHSLETPDTALARVLYARQRSQDFSRRKRTAFPRFGQNLGIAR